MRVALLIASYDEGDRLAATLLGIARVSSPLGGAHAFVVDDGGTIPVRLADLPGATASFRVTLARHATNLGQGAALETARRLALREGPDRFAAYVTMDADGQHREEDLPRLVAAIDDGADAALGDRFAAGSDVPLARRILLSGARAFEGLLLGRRLHDAHNGFRAFGPRAIRRVALRRDGMAHATEIALKVLGTRDLRVVEVPVTIRYDDALLAKGQRALGAIAIVRDLVAGYLYDGTAP